MSFLDALVDQIDTQFKVGENSNRKLDIGNLQYDKSAQRSYVEEGYLKRDPYNTDTKRIEVLLQEPSAMILLKKRQFSSIAENFHTNYMDKDELLYYRTMKILFQNKCKKISALEKLSKIQQITSSVGNVNEQLMPIIFTLADSISGGNNILGFGTSSNGADQLNKIIDRIRKVYTFNADNPFTTWINDTSNLFQSQFGQGTGVIELTNFTSLNTNCGINIGSSYNFNFNLYDPYEATIITELDIEQAIADATNLFYNHKIFQFSEQGAEQVIADAQYQLNQLRSSRKASPISIKVNPDTLLYKRVIAIVDRTGQELNFVYDSSGALGFPGLGGAGRSIKVSDEYLKDGSVLGFDGLDGVPSKTFNSNGTNINKLVPESEKSVFSRLIAAIFNKIQLEQNSKNAFQTTNQNTNYTRKKLRFNFAGQPIIQPMDVINIYIDSKSRYDNRLMTGISNMFNGLGILQNANKTITDLSNSLDTVFNSSTSILQVEKAAYVGADFPNFLWSLMRNQFVVEKDGVHVFAGVVENATDNWSNGVFTLDVSGRDNTYYFDQGKVNFKPGVDAFNGYYFDPLTPFKSNFDNISNFTNSKIPDLLEENKVLLGNSKDTSLAKFKLGPFAGEKVRPDNYLLNNLFDITTGKSHKVFYAPDGLVYKWKEGIGIFTQLGNSLELNGSIKTGNPNIFKEPFAGLDVMNTLSLLIVGIPYNFSTYFKATQNIEGFNNDPQSLQNAAYSFFNSLSQDLVKRNTLWGNFIPFKRLIVDEPSYVQALNKQTSITNSNGEIENQLKQLSDLQRQAIIFGAINTFIPNSNEAKADNAQLSEVQAKINNLRTNIQNNIDSLAQQDKQFFNQFGVDSSFEINQLSGVEKQNAAISNPKIRNYLRQQINQFTRRMSYNVRANEDKNLFIVDDSYDKDYDLMAYNQALSSGIQIYDSIYDSVRDKISRVANILDLEVFCDTQGHIRIRPPQYNRMPSSVFYRMMQLKKSLGVQVYPQFLEDLFGSQIDSLKTQIEVIEDQIRLFAAIIAQSLNYSNISTDNDIYAIQILQTNDILSGVNQTFSFISDPTSGEISDIHSLLKQSNPDQDEINQNLNNLSPQATSSTISFTNSQRFSLINNVLSAKNLQQSGYSLGTAGLQTTVVNDLISRIQTKSGQKISTQDYISNIDAGIKNVDFPITKTIDIFKISKDLSDKIKERQTFLKTYYNTVKNAAEYKFLDTGNTSGNELLTPGNFGSSKIPELLNHMIEDEAVDDYGIGSGKRYVIKRSQIKSLTITVNAPTHTALRIDGVLNSYSPDSLPPNFSAFPDGGNAMITAFAVDYDMWRNFGFKQVAPITVPFLKDPVSQLGPYAAMMLSKNRKNILQASLVITGNEFMQPGEVIYLEDRGLLFYVNSVNHSFKEGGSFQTSLSLSYGHTPGDYIPTVLDIIGKLIYKNGDTADTIIQRQESSEDALSLAALQRYAQNPSPKELLNQTTTKQTSLFTSQDLDTLNNILYNISYIIHSNNTKGQNTKIKLELRVYYDDNNSANTELLDLADIVKGILQGTQKEFDDILKKGSKNISLPKINGDGTDTIEIVQVNMNDDNDRSSPSQKAMNLARLNMKNVQNTLVAVNSITGNANIIADNNKLRHSLFNYVIDCWLKIEQIPTNEIKK